MANIVMKVLAIAFVVCFFALTNVLSQSASTKSPTEVGPSDVIGTSVPPQKAVPQTSKPDSQSATGGQDQVLATTEAGTHSVSPMVKENISPDEIQTNSKDTTSTTGSQNNFTPTTQVSTGGLSSVVKDEGQSATDIATSNPNSPSALEDTTAIESHNKISTGQQGVTDEDYQKTTKLPDVTTAVNSTAKEPQTTAVITAAPVPKPERSFDLISFIGGLLVAACFVLILVFFYCCSKSGKGKSYENLK